MLVLFETSAGFTIFKLQDDGALKDPENLFKHFENESDAKKLINLKHFFKFEDMTQALSAATALMEGKISPNLKSALKKVLGKSDKIAVGDLKLASSIQKKFKVECVYNSAVSELMRCIRFKYDDLISGQVPQQELNAMTLGLAHSLSRYKIKFSPDKVDTMIVQAVGLLEDLDKELNIYMMRAREWYGGHFPELLRICPENLTFARVVKTIGNRANASYEKLTDVVEEELAAKICNIAKVSMGTEIGEEDLENIRGLVNEILELSEYREYLFDYLKNRMNAIAPNLTQIVGELVGARLISKAGSLMNLAKQAASTIQVMGAEKALFRSIKSNKPTPKYGLIYHAGLVGQASSKYKGRMSRMIANKSALATRVDALGNAETKDIAPLALEKLQAALNSFSDSNNTSSVQRSALKKEKLKKYVPGNEPAKTYNARDDFTIKNIKKRTRDETQENIDNKIVDDRDDNNNNNNSSSISTTTNTPSDISTTNITTTNDNDNNMYGEMPVEESIIKKRKISEDITKDKILKTVDEKKIRKSEDKKDRKEDKKDRKDDKKDRKDDKKEGETDKKEDKKDREKKKKKIKDKKDKKDSE